MYYYSDRTPGAVSNAAGLIRLIQPDTDTQATEVLFELMAASGKQIAFRGYLTSFAMTCSVGEVVSAEIQFTGSGPLTELSMTIYMGGDGAIELKRKATHDITETLQPSDVYVAARSFSVGLRIEQSLFTGDRVEIRTADGSPLQLVDGSTSDGWGGWIHVDAVGGVRLYSNYQNAIKGGYDWALDLVAPSKPQELIFHTQDASYRFLAGISKFEFTTERSTVDITQLGDEFRGQFDAGLISGQGNIDTQWIAPSMCDEYCDEAEFPRYFGTKYAFALCKALISLGGSISTAHQK